MVLAGNAAEVSSLPLICLPLFIRILSPLLLSLSPCLLPIPDTASEG